MFGADYAADVCEKNGNYFYTIPRYLLNILGAQQTSEVSLTPTF